MNGLTVFCVALCVGLAAAAVVPAVPEVPTYFGQIESRIVGGRPAVAGQFPFLASLRRANGNHFCGSSIIDPRWVLSAAHCSEDFANNGITVVVGALYLATGGDRHQSNLIVNHPEYNRARLTNDISLIRVATPFNYGTLVQPIAIGTATIGTAAATVLGWGLLEHEGVLPESLQYLPTQIITQADCRARHNVINRQFVHDNVICSLNEAGQGMCSGDSGGALVVGNTVVGIPSWVIPCGRGFPDAYARVSSHNSWIVGTMNANP